MTETTKVVKSAAPPNAGKGRPKGSQNKSTAAVKEALSMAFEGLGGVPQLTTWAMDNPTEFYKLWVKMLPQDVNANVAATITEVKRTLVRPPDRNG
jgi:hypothetical protein